MSVYSLKPKLTQGTTALLIQYQSGGETVLAAIGLSDNGAMHGAATVLQGESVAIPFSGSFPRPDLPFYSSYCVQPL